MNDLLKLSLGGGGDYVGAKSSNVHDVSGGSTSSGSKASTSGSRKKLNSATSKKQPLLP